MVGVPRSKGCRICVQRRVKCDQTRPTCNNCKRGNRPCPGYDSDLKFQDEGAKLRKRFERKTETSDQILQPPVNESTSASTSSTPESSESDSSLWTTIVADRWLTAARPNWIPDMQVFDLSTEAENGSNDEFANELDVIGCEIVPLLLSQEYAKFEHPFKFLTSTVPSPYMEQHQLFANFLESTFMRPQKAMPRPMLAHRNWLSELVTHVNTDPLLDCAVRAVSLAHLGRVQGSDLLLNESRPLYGKALRLLSGSLSDGGKGLASDTLSATVLLSFYEMFQSDSNTSWIRHAGGAAALMKARGPARHRYGIDRQIFLAYRYMILIESFEKDEGCFLYEPEWRELSRCIHEDMLLQDLSEDHREILTLSEEYFQSMLPITTFIRDSKKLRNRLKTHSLSSVRAFRDEVLDRGILYRANLKTTNARFRALLAKLGLTPTSYTSGDPVFPTFYLYVNVFLASTCVGYYTVLMLLNTVLREMQRVDNPEAVTLYSMENREVALECCRSVAYLQTSSFLGPFFVIFALRMSLTVFPSGRESDWIIMKLFQIGSTHMRMASHIPGFAPGTGLPRIRAVVQDGGYLEELPEVPDWELHELITSRSQAEVGK